MSRPCSVPPKREKRFSFGVKPSKKMVLNLITVIMLTKQISDWYYIGNALGLPVTELKDIQCRHTQNYDRAKLDMFLMFIRKYNEIPWINVAVILNMMGYLDSADIILDNIKKGL